MSTALTVIAVSLITAYFASTVHPKKTLTAEQEFELTELGVQLGRSLKKQLKDTAIQTCPIEMVSEAWGKGFLVDEGYCSRTEEPEAMAFALKAVQRGWDRESKPKKTVRFASPLEQVFEDNPIDESCYYYEDEDETVDQVAKPGKAVRFGRSKH